jgi:hypothetical protein
VAGGPDVDREGWNEVHRAGQKQGKARQHGAARLLDTPGSFGALAELVRLLARQAAREFIASPQEPDGDHIDHDQVE